MPDEFIFIFRERHEPNDMVMDTIYIHGGSSSKIHKIKRKSSDEMRIDNIYKKLKRVI